MMLYKVDVEYIGTDTDYKLDRYLIRVLDAKDGAEYTRCTWIGRQSDALKAGVRMAEAYKKGVKDGEARALDRVLDMVEQWGGRKL